MNQLSTPGARLSFLIDNILKIRPVDFSTRMGIGYMYLSQMKGGHKPITRKILFKMDLVFPEVNTDWISSGKGAPMKKTDSNRSSQDDLPPQVNESSADHLPADRIAFGDVPGLLLAIMDEIKRINSRLEALELSVNQINKSAE